MLDPMKQVAGPNAGQHMSEDEKWLFFAQKATDEDDPDLYAKSGYDPELGF